MATAPTSSTRVTSTHLKLAQQILSRGGIQKSDSYGYNTLWHSQAYELAEFISNMGKSEGARETIQTYIKNAINFTRKYATTHRQVMKLLNKAWEKEYTE